MNYMKSITHAFLSLTFSFLAATAFAGGAVNVDGSGVGIQGYDPFVLCWTFPSFEQNSVAKTLALP